MQKNVLIIEDDPDILDMMSYILRDEGFQVITSMETVSVEYVLELDPTLILLDNRLADGYGRDLCLKLKAHPATRHYPVVLVSAVAYLPQIAKDSGADSYLNKPFDLEDLIALVRRFT